MKVTVNNSPISKEQGIAKSVTDNISSKSSETNKSDQLGSYGLSTGSYNNIQNKLNSIPDVNLEKVNEIRNLIAQGKYNFDSAAIADKMIADSMVEDN